MGRASASPPELERGETAAGLVLRASSYIPRAGIFLCTPLMVQGLPNIWLNLKGKGQGEVKPHAHPNPWEPGFSLTRFPTDCECHDSEQRQRIYLIHVVQKAVSSLIQKRGLRPETEDSGCLGLLRHTYNPVKESLVSAHLCTGPGLGLGEFSYPPCYI